MKNDGPCTKLIDHAAKRLFFRKLLTLFCAKGWQGAGTQRAEQGYPHAELDLQRSGTEGRLRFKGWRGVFIKT